jgi:hypothetical protein
MSILNPKSTMKALCNNRIVGHVYQLTTTLKTKEQKRSQPIATQNSRGIKCYLYQVINEFVVAVFKVSLSLSQKMNCCQKERNRCLKYNKFAVCKR